jgi:hypothetical protein
MRVPLALVAVLVVLAGCTGTPADPASDAEEAAFDDLGLAATSTTGLIRGVVVDEAIRPLAGASIEARGPAGEELSATSGEVGAFGFDGLPPGTYFLKVRKLGYHEVQQSAEVVAGVAEPAIAKVVLPADAAGIPFAVTLTWDGFVQCSTDVVAACAGPDAGSQIACSATTGGQPPVPPSPVPVCMGNVTGEDFDEWYQVDGVPTYLQVEMAWETTQTVSQTFSINVRAAERETYLGGFYEFSIDGASGPSPLTVKVDAEDIEDAEVGNRTGLITAVFSGAAENNPTGIGGFVVQQRFSVFITLFYGYQPPEDWTFVATGTVPPPA